MKSRWCGSIVAVLSAALLWAAFPPMCETANLAVALAPMLAVARLCNPKRSASLWFQFGMIYWMATLSWMPAIIKNNGPWPLVLLGWAGLAAVCAAYFMLYGWLSSLAWQRMGRWALAAEPVLWAGCEWMRATLFTGFAWNFLGVAASHVPVLATPARLGGAYLVSALVVLVNGVFATLACRVVAQMRRERQTSVSRLARSLETAIPLCVVLLTFWISRSAAAPDGRTESVPLRVALVQRNAPCIFSSAVRTNPVDEYDRLVGTVAATRPDLMVWAESAMAEFGGRVDGVRAREAATRCSQALGGAALLAGGDWISANGRCHNAAALYGADGSVQTYGKQHLVPFGEYIPFDKLVPALQKLSPIGLSLWPGEATVFELDAGSRSARLAPLICYEDTDPSLSRKAARKGAQAIVLITNDSWFSNSSETVQHAAQAVLRAIETGLPVVRVGNSGVTGVISPDGRTRWLSDGNGKPLVDAQGTMVDTVELVVAPRLTPYVRLGDWPMIVFFLLAVLIILFPSAAMRSSLLRHR